MTRRYSFLGLFLGATLPSSALAGTVIIPGAEEVVLSIDARVGSLVQLPSSVKTITPSENFSITDVAPSFDSASGAKVDVRLFVVKPITEARSERVTFVLGDGRSVRVRFTPAAEAERHYDLVFPGEAKKVRNPRFLGTEVALMRALIRDEGGTFARQETSESVALAGLDGFKATLTRVFATGGLAGYAFEIRNVSGARTTVPVTTISLGSPNRAVLVHADKDVLESCRLVSSPDCIARLLIVARGDVTESRSLGVSSGEPAPFMRPDAREGGMPYE